MILLVDAYNVLKQAVMSHEATAQEKIAFIAMVRRYATLKKVIIELVFDGGPYGLQDRHATQNIIVSHSGSQKTADDVIKELIVGYKGRELLLVSTDRELGRYAQMHQVDVIDSADFYRLMKTAIALVPDEPKAPKELVKTAQETMPEVDRLMAEYTQQIKKGSCEITQSAVMPRGKKLSKDERRLEKKLKKL